MNKTIRHVNSILDKHATRKSVKSLLNMTMNEIKQVNLINAFADIDVIRGLDGIALQNYLLHHFNIITA